MPTYEFCCDEENGGCGNVIEISCSFDDLDDKKPKSCPKCHKRKTIYRLFGWGANNIPCTLGSHAEKNHTKMSDEQKHEIHMKDTAYLRQDNFWKATPEGMRPNVATE